MKTWIVEMTGRLGYTCHVTIIADKETDADYLASRRFPELSVSAVYESAPNMIETDAVPDENGLTFTRV